MNVNVKAPLQVDVSTLPEDRKPLIGLNRPPIGTILNAPSRTTYSQLSQRFSHTIPGLTRSQGSRLDDPLRTNTKPRAAEQVGFVKSSTMLRGGISPKLEPTDPFSYSNLRKTGELRSQANAAERIQNTQNTHKPSIKMEYVTATAPPALGHAGSAPSNTPVAEQATTKPAASAPEATVLRLSAEQQAVLERVKRGESLFFTGSAGVGKSVLTSTIIRELRDKYGGQPRAVAVTATTGIAACNIGGTTLHSWAGIGLGKGEAHDMAWQINNEGEVTEDQKKKMGNPDRTAARWRECRVLIVDEISMLDGKLFDVSAVAPNDGQH